MGGVLGMLFEAGVYVALYPALQPINKGLANWGKITLPVATATSPWMWVARIVVILSLALWLLERYSRQNHLSGNA